MSKLFNRSGIHFKKGRLLYTSEGFGAKWIPYPIQRLIVRTWNYISCKILGHEWWPSRDNDKKTFCLSCCKTKYISILILVSSCINGCGNVRTVNCKFKEGDTVCTSLTNEFGQIVDVYSINPIRQLEFCEYKVRFHPHVSYQDSLWLKEFEINFCKGD